MTDALAISVRIECKQPALPRFAIVPATVIQPWGLTETTVIEGTLNGVPIGRRTIKKWDDELWWIDIPQTLCRQAKVDTGETVSLEIRLASTELPEELAALLKSNPAVKAAWDKLTSGQQRMFRENVASAKTPETRSRRASGLLR
jgi:hypothetical protein